MDDVSLVYYGHVFDATGYGHAARGYLHALHAAGVKLSVVDLMKHDRQVRDELIESLIGGPSDADFHLFHGIPPQWARLAFPLRNAIGMTVWETDTMPMQWRTALSHVLEVWLPCEFNVSVFKRGLRTPLFKLPHVAWPPSANGNGSAAADGLGLRPDDFVFYSIFEWQDRKCPLELLTAYLRAFPSEDDVALVVKSNPGSARIAQDALTRARQQNRSTARVIIRAETWTSTEVDALHRRGDVYVSLHRGEGWCYPLFEAAARGKPVVATGYGGPMEYLSADFAQLVPYELQPVRQAYQYYHPTMRWAQPDLAVAVQHLRWAYANRETARARALAASKVIRHTYSPEIVGAAAREQLLATLKRTNTRRWQQLRRARVAAQPRPPQPVPPEWYDRGYFEDGTKSNWVDGYHWTAFAGVFTETAAFLDEMFPDAGSFLDLGCAKGFLVRALRERGKECWGVDHSSWAIEHAESAARPYLMCASAADVNLDRSFDVVVALELLPHLTCDQTVRVLSRIRLHTGMGIVAVIRSFENEEDERQYHLAQDDGDLSHVLMRTRGWWHARFLECGWRQDAVHRAFERQCQRHELTRKMGWQMYVYAV